MQATPAHACMHLVMQSMEEIRLETLWIVMLWKTSGHSYSFCVHFEHYLLCVAVITEREIWTSYLAMHDAACSVQQGIPTALVLEVHNL